MNYHKNAKTNSHIRKLISQSSESIRSLAEKYKISKTTVFKWKNSDVFTDKSSKPINTHKTLSKIEERIIISVRRHLKMPLDDIVSTLSRYIPKLNRINCWRTLKKYSLSVIPKPFQERGKFKKYNPGFIHIDLAYLPFLGERRTRLYLLVAIDRITKLVFLKIVSGKQQFQAIKFLHELIKFFPYAIHRILTDNGKEVAGKFTKECGGLKIKHKKTKIKHPWTNGQAETTIKQIKVDTIWKNYYKDDNDLIRALISWQNTYNLKDKLRSIKGLTPYEKVVEYFQELKIKKQEKQIFHRIPTYNNLTVCTITL